MSFNVKDRQTDVHTTKQTSRMTGKTERLTVIQINKYLESQDEKDGIVF